MSLRISSVLIFAFAALGAVSHAAAQTDHSMHGKPAAKAASNAPDAALADGVVKKIDKASKRITIAHDKLPNGMPAMTMAFAVKDVTWLDQVQAGQKIRFATDTGDGMTVVRLELVK